jgi:hypothetical protein
MAFLEGFLVSLSMAVLQWAAKKAGIETIEYISQHQEMQRNKEKADEFKKNKNGKTREERKNAEVNLLR